MRQNRGFTFIEIMVTLVVLTGGVAIILKSFMATIDQMNHLTNRLNANIILENKMASLQHQLRVYETLPFELEPVDNSSRGKPIHFEPKMNLSGVGDFKDIFKLDLTVSWKEQGRDLHLSRSAYLSNFR